MPIGAGNKSEACRIKNANSHLVSILRARGSLLGTMSHCTAHTPHKRGSCYNVPKDHCHTFHFSKESVKLKIL